MAAICAILPHTCNAHPGSSVMGVPTISFFATVWGGRKSPNASHGIPASRGLGWTLTPFGGYCLDFVRGGLYSAQLRPWAERYGAGAILVTSLAELKRAPVAAMQRLVRHAVGSTLMDAEVSRVLEHHNSRPENSLVNSRRFDRALPGAVQPQNRTLALLTRFYRASKLALEVEYGVVPADS